MARAGRKEKYESHVKPYLDRIPVWRRQGMTEEQVAEKLRIGYSTLSYYKNQYAELLEALKSGRADLIEELEETLYTRAKGQDAEETKIVKYKDDSGNEQTRIEKTKKKIHSDACLIFALKNLDPARWRERQEIVNKEDPDKLTKEEVQRKIDEIKAKQKAKNENN